MNCYCFFSKFYRRAAGKMCLECRQFIKEGSKILDLGCGSGIVGKTFQDFFKAELFGIDIIDRRVVKIPFQIYDGVNLPFPEKSFDIVMINYVLHHVGDLIPLLKEVKRVAKDKVIIFEDLPEGFLSKIICKLHGKSYSKFFQNPEKTSFKIEKEWEGIFKETGFNIIFKKRQSDFPVKKELFVLGV